MTDSPAYLSPEQMVKLEKKGRLYIPGHSAVMKRSALLRAGKYIPELKFSVDWFADYVIGFRHGICVVPEPLAVFNIQPNSYYQRCRKDERDYQQVLKLMLDLLMQPDYQDAAKYIREAGSLYIFGWPMFKVLTGSQKYRPFINPTFLRKNLWHATKVKLKEFTPTALGNLYFRLAGYRSHAGVRSS